MQGIASLIGNTICINFNFPEYSVQSQDLRYSEDKKKLFHETFSEIEKATFPAAGENVVASGIIYSLFDDYDQPKLSLAVSNMAVTCEYYGWLECHRPA